MQVLHVQKTRAMQWYLSIY